MFEFKTKPFRHQLEEFESSRSNLVRGILWQQGTGKSKLVIDQTAWLYDAGEIDALLVLAPNGVHQNWETDELPAHCPIPYQAHSWSSKSASAKWHQRAVASLLESTDLAILLMSYDAFMTKAGRKLAEKFAEKRKVMCVCDESQRIKTPRAKRTQSVVAFGRRFEYKRILSGTPITNSPFDIYPQLKFLNEDFWKQHGFARFEPFKTYFGVWEQRINNKGQRFPNCLYFKNLEKLYDIVRTICSRVTKEEVLDLPEKIYSKRYFEMSSQQKNLYEDLKTEFIAKLEGGELVTAPLIVTRILRLQQITCGYLPSDDCEQLNVLPENPRLRLLLDTLADVDGQAIIFARFRHDIDQICEELKDQCVRYDGRVGDAARLEARKAFQAGSIHFFVGNPAACGVGLTLHAASTVIYYSNSFNLEHRLQSEDRAHRIGQTCHVRYIDLVAKGTLDAHIVQSLRDKFNIASKITGDEVRKWL